MIQKRTFLEYFTVAILSLVGAALIMHLWRGDMRIPFSYDGDATLLEMVTKSIVDTGSYLVNHSQGAPGGYNLADFPVVHNIYFLVVKISSYFTKDYALIFNSYFLLTFPLVAIAGLFVFKKLGLSLPFAMVASLLFAFRPYHFIASEPSLLLNEYYIVPLIIWLAVLIAENKLFLPESNSEFFNNNYIRITIYGLICIIAGSEFVYYTFFSAFFLLVAGLIGSLNKRKLLPLLQAFALVSVISATFLVNMTPAFINRIHHGKNPVVAVRSPIESQLYGMTIIQMLLPVSSNSASSHYLTRLHADYDKTAAIYKNSENSFTILGMFGSIGFLILMCMLLVRRPRYLGKEIVILSNLNIYAVLLGTVGGFGTVFAYTVSPMIRGYARISVYIMFFSLFAIFWAIQFLLTKYNIINRKKLLWLIASILLVVGVITQTDPSFAIGSNKAAFESDAKFIEKIEKTEPAGSMIFQLPYVFFPEAGQVNNMLEYEHAKAYLHSHSLAWSYGAIRGRMIDSWQERMSKLPIPEFVNNLVYVGFKGIYIDRRAYQDQGADIEGQLSRLLNEQPFASENGNLSFFDLQNYSKKLQASQSISEWQSHVLQAKLPVTYYVFWGKGSSNLEGTPDANWRWCDKSALFYLTNNTDKPAYMRLNFKIATGFSDYADVSMKSNLFNGTYKVNQSGVSIDKIIKVPPGEYKVEINTNAKRVITKDDPRKLYFQIINFKSEYVGA